MQAYIWWSLYVRASNAGKVKAEHLPPIEEAVEGTDFSWEIMREGDAPGLFRLVNYQNIVGSSVEGLIVPALRRAYKLAPSWKIQGLGDLASGRLRHVGGSCSNPPSMPRPPALVSLAFEVEPGCVKRKSADGGWSIINDPVG